MSKKSSIISTAAKEAQAVKDLATRKVQESILRELAPQIEKTILGALQNPDSKTAALKAVTAKMVSEAKVNFELGDETEMNIDATDVGSVGVDFDSSDDTALFDEEAEGLDVGGGEEDLFGDDLFADDEAEMDFGEEAEESFGGEEEAEFEGDDDLGDLDLGDFEDEGLEEEGAAEEEDEAEGEPEELADSLQRRGDQTKDRLLVESRILVSANRAKNLRVLINECETVEDLNEVSKTISLLGESMAHIASRIDNLQDSKGLTAPYRTLVGALSKLQESLAAKRAEMRRRKLYEDKEEEVIFTEEDEDEDSAIALMDDPIEIDFSELITDEDDAGAPAEGSDVEAVKSSLKGVKETFSQLEEDLEDLLEDLDDELADSDDDELADEDDSAEEDFVEEEVRQDESRRRRRTLAARRLQEARRREGIRRRRLLEAARRERRQRAFEAAEERATAMAAHSIGTDALEGREFDVDFTLEEQLDDDYRRMHGERVSRERPRATGVESLNERKLKRKLAESRLETEKYKAAAKIVANEAFSLDDKKTIVEAIDRAKSVEELRGTFKTARMIVEREIRKTRQEGSQEARRQRVIAEARQRLQERRRARVRAEQRERLTEARQRRAEGQGISESRTRGSISEAGASLESWKRIAGTK